MVQEEAGVNHLIFILLNIMPFAPSTNEVFFLFLPFSIRAQHCHVLFLEGTGDSLFPFPRHAGGRVILKPASLPVAR